MRTVQGSLIGTGLRFAIVVSRFNELISGRLLDGAMDALIRHDVKQQNIDLFWVPGAWELPLIAHEAALSGKYDAIVALGAVIQGDTPHFGFICAEMSKGLGKVAIEQRVPVGFGVVTTSNLEQALARAGSKSGNKGVDAAIAALEMANLLRESRKTMGLGDKPSEEGAR
ncbi:MAG: 6,7-dimethyl-8-ribityllumazine synthase [Synergistaceae bacterium]|jgi:6,7-dimethyl-8-ribityllumazine synthase|nr:6,7-dimethyl-8-ribityllumazine synthase [Synergistaceae bacterium]